MAKINCSMKILKALGLLITSFLLLNSGHVAYAQDDTEYEVPSKWYLSPDFGLVLGNVTSIEVAPAIGYHLTPRFSMGLGGRYEFFRQLDPFSRQEVIRTDIWGARAFSRLMLIPNLDEILPFRIEMGIFAHAEMEALYLEKLYYSLNPAQTEGRFWHKAVLTGLGISQRTGARSYVNFLVLWDLTNTSASPYINPIIRFGIQIYL